MKNTTKQSKQFSIFDFVKAIIDTKPSWNTFTPDQHKTFNGFMINKFLSMNPKYIDVVNYVQGLNIKDSKKLYKVYCWMIPKSKNTYSPFIKNNIKQSINPVLLEKISQYHECSLGEAEEYFYLLRKEGVEDILIKLGVEEKEIKKLVKNG